MIPNNYNGVETRFLRKDERLINTAETEMPLVIEAKERTDLEFLKNFLQVNSERLMQDVGQYLAAVKEKVHSPE